MPHSSVRIISHISDTALMFQGGVIHGIDKVILPGSYRPCPMMYSSSSSKGKGTKKMAGQMAGKGSSSSSSSGKGSKRRH